MNTTLENLADAYLRLGRHPIINRGKLQGIRLACDAMPGTCELEDIPEIAHEQDPENDFRKQWYTLEETIIQEIGGLI